MKRIFLVRHGNAYDTTGHQKPESPLNEAGLAHAKALSERLKDFKIDRVYASTMTRARNTCEAFLSFHKDIEVNFADDYRELFDYGVPTTRDVAHIMINDYQQSQEKVIRSIQKMFEDAPENSNTFVFTHGNFIRLAVLGVVGGNIDGFFRIRIDFTSISMIELMPNGELKIGFVNDCRHTTGLPFGCDWC